MKILLFTFLAAVALGQESTGGMGTSEGGLIDQRESPNELPDSSTPAASSTSPPQKNNWNSLYKPCCKMPWMTDDEIMASSRKCARESLKRIADFWKKQRELRKNNSSASNTTMCVPKPDGCHIECVYNRSSLLTADGKLDSEAIKSRMNAILELRNASSWKELVGAAMDNCKAVVAGIPADQRCKSGASEVSYCFFKYLFLNCPKDAWRNDENCKKRKDFIASNTPRRQPARRIPYCEITSEEEPPK